MKYFNTMGDFTGWRIPLHAPPTFFNCWIWPRSCMDEDMCECGDLPREDCMCDEIEEPDPED